MPYSHLEQVLDRKGEKVALFLTLENVVGILVFAGPPFVILSGAPLLVRIGLMIVGALVGLVLTMDNGGAPNYQRILWNIRGFVRRKIKGAMIAPETITGFKVTTRSAKDRAVLRHGPIQVVRRTQPSARTRAARVAVRPATAARSTAGRAVDAQIAQSVQSIHADTQTEETHDHSEAQELPNRADS